MTTTEDAPGPQLIELGKIIDYYTIGFKLVPIGTDGKTPRIESTTAIYNNPNYWNIEKLQQEHWRFNNIGFVFGKTHVKDDNAADLYLNELDIDSEEVYNRVKDLLEEMQANTFVTKTRKPYGYRIVWFSHKQNVAIGTRRCKSGYEFEIKTDNSTGHSTLPDSIHRSDPTFRYSSAGQNSITVNDELYDWLIKTLADCVNPESEQKKQSTNKDNERSTVGRTIELTKTNIEQIIALLNPYYKIGYRHDICYSLGGLLRKCNVLKVCAYDITNGLANDDEELDSRLLNFEITYSKDPKEVTGRNYFKDIVVRLIQQDKKLKLKDVLDLADNLFENILRVIGVAIGIVGEATEAIMNEHRFVTIEETDDILYYRDGVYVSGGDVLIKKKEFALYGYDLELRHKREIKDYIMQQTYHKLAEFDTDLDIINLKSGLYHVSTNTLSEHDPDYLSMIQKSIIYDSEAKPKLYDKFLGEVLYPSDIQTAIDTQAYTFHRRNPFELINILLGDGLNGKSVFMSILRAGHGINGISTVPLRKLADPDDRFSLAQLENKDINFDAELSKGFIEDASTLKKLTGNMEIFIEEKNKPGRSVRIHAKLFNSANDLPQTTDLSTGFFRRYNILSFPNKFEEGEEGTDPEYESKLTSPDEISGIFNMWMNALRGILKNKRIFMNEKTSQQRRTRYEMAANPIQAFIDEAIMEESKEISDTVTKEDTYQAFLLFCKEKRLHTITKALFGRGFKRTYPHGEYRTYWTGIKLKKEYWPDPNKDPSFSKEKEEMSSE